MDSTDVAQPNAHPFPHQMSKSRRKDRIGDCCMARCLDSLLSNGETLLYPRNPSDLCLYFKEWTYITPQQQAETGRTFKRRVYDTLRKMYTARKQPQEILVMKPQPAMEWSLVWDQFHKVIFADGVGSTLHMAIRGIIPTNLRLHRTRLTNTHECTQWARQYALLYRLTGCGKKQEIWERTHLRTATIRRTEPRHIPKERLICPCFKIWPRP